MREAHRSAIVAHPAGAMFRLVADVAAYPDFLPGCLASEVISRDEDGMVASLTLGRGPLNATFTTRNRFHDSRGMSMELLEGPFRELHGEWTLAPLGESGCRVELRVRFEFSNAAGDLVLGPVLEATCNGIVDAFVRRAKDLYG